jgi:hypothetical protein
MSVSKTPSVTPSITPSTSCARPPVSYESYTWWYSWNTISFLDSLSYACEAFANWGLGGEYNGQGGFVVDLNVGRKIYLGSGTSCDTLTPSGYRIITPLGGGTAIGLCYVLNGVITSYPSCPDPTPSATLNLSPSVTPTITPSITPSITVSPSRTPSITPSITKSISVSPTRTPSITPSITKSISVSPSITPSISLSLAVSRTPSVTTSISPSPSPAVPSAPSGQVACWGFEEPSGTLYDSSGNYNLTTINSITYGATGKISNCISLDASTDYTRGPDTGLELTNFSVSAWVKTSDATIKKCVFSKVKGGASYNRGYSISITADGHPQISLHWNSTDHGGVVEESLVSTSAAINDGNWHHIVMTYSNTGPSMKCYIDGQHDGTGTPSYVVIYDTNVASLYVGNSRYETNGFIGSLDEISVWDNTLSLSNVLYLYNSGSGRSCPGLVQVRVLNSDVSQQLTITDVKINSNMVVISPTYPRAYSTTISSGTTPSVGSTTVAVYLSGTNSYADNFIDLKIGSGHDFIDIPLGTDTTAGSPYTFYGVPVSSTKVEITLYAGSA